MIVVLKVRDPLELLRHAIMGPSLTTLSEALGCGPTG